MTDWECYWALLISVMPISSFSIFFPGTPLSFSWLNSLLQMRETFLLFWGWYRVDLGSLKEETQ